ncbi:MAG TPA: hypothetical protein PKC18_05755, partial [Lacipirellulaceae bacterium]|nr:hypothetical protein [Lacipirellulaceae bacterium]
MNRQLRGWCCLLAIAVVACHHRDALGIYVSTAGVTSPHSSDFGGDPAQNAVDSALSGYRADWTFATGTVNGDAGYVLRTDVHGNWHSLNDPNPKQSPSGTMAREWIAADFGVVHKMRGADFWNSNWNVISQTRAAKSVSIDVSADGSSWTNVWSGDLSQAPGTLPDLMYDGTTYIHP